MKTLTFDDIKTANETYKAFVSKGVKADKPLREKRAKSAKKAYDLNGKLLKYRWTVKLRGEGIGYGGGALSDAEEEEAEQEYFKSKVEGSATAEEKAKAVEDIIDAKSKAYTERDIAIEQVLEEWTKRGGAWKEKAAEMRQKLGKTTKKRLPATRAERKEAAAETFTKTHESHDEASEFAAKQRHRGRKAYVIYKKGKWTTFTGTKQALEAPETLKAAKQQEKKKREKRKEKFEKPLKEIKKGTRLPMHVTGRHVAKTLLHKPSSFVPLEGKHYAIGGGASMVPGRFPRIAALPEHKDITDMYRSPF